MLIVGLTGGIASGKSTVAGFFRNEGAYVIDADAISREVVEPERAGWQEIADAFGPQVLKADRTIDRKYLGEIVFSDPDKRRMLESILHPRIHEEQRRQIEGIGLRDAHAVVVVDIPLLIEVKKHTTVDAVVLVYVPPPVQVRRLMERDGIRLEDAEKRLAAQMPINKKVKYADFVINNEGPLEETERKVKELFNELRGAAAFIAAGRQKNRTEQA